MVAAAPPGGAVAQWRSSLQLRVVTTALAIGARAIVVLGAVPVDAVRDGIYEQRLAAIDREAAARSDRSQRLLGTATTSDATCRPLLTDSSRRCSTGGSTAEEYFLLRAPGTTAG